MQCLTERAPCGLTSPVARRIDNLNTADSLRIVRVVFSDGSSGGVLLASRPVRPLQGRVQCQARHHQERKRFDATVVSPERQIHRQWTLDLFSQPVSVASSERNTGAVGSFCLSCDRREVTHQSTTCKSHHETCREQEAFAQPSVS